KEFEVFADSNWTSTGIMVTSGARVHLLASGVIEAAPDSDAREYYHAVPPSGREELQQQFPYPKMPGLGLVARVGNGPVQAVGGELSWTASKESGVGVLHLGINDDIVDDNEGHWLVKVQLSTSLSPD